MDVSAFNLLLIDLEKGNFLGHLLSVKTCALARLATSFRYKTKMDDMIQDGHLKKDKPGSTTDRRFN